jgi:hypothetical protein
MFRNLLILVREWWIRRRTAKRLWKLYELGVIRIGPFSEFFGRVPKMPHPDAILVFGRSSEYSLILGLGMGHEGVVGFRDYPEASPYWVTPVPAGTPASHVATLTEILCAYAARAKATRVLTEQLLDSRRHANEIIRCVLGDNTHAVIRWERHNDFGTIRWGWVVTRPRPEDVGKQEHVLTVQ